MRSTDIVMCERLLADPRSARGAREILRRALDGVDGDWLERAELAVTELVTNAVVHAGSEVELRVRLRAHSLRVEVADDNATLPASRNINPAAGTGRGLQMVEWAVDRWGADRHAGGKTVWFELGEATSEAADLDPDAGSGEDVRTEVGIVLLKVPLLMHRAWQEHTSTVLRDYLLARIEDDPAVLERHARASEAMALLFDQLPALGMPDTPEEILVASSEPAVTAERVVLHVPVDVVDYFATLNDLIEEALVMARRGELLATPTQPEVMEMRRWMCEQVRSQARGDAPTPYQRSLVSVRKTTGDDPRFRSLAARPDGLLVVDTDNYIVAVTRPVVDILGYHDEQDLLGHRVLIVIPERFRQAHIAQATTRQAPSEEALEAPVLVPMARADGSEILVQFRVEPVLYDDEVAGYVGHLDLVQPS